MCWKWTTLGIGNKELLSVTAQRLTKIAMFRPMFLKLSCFVAPFQRQSTPMAPCSTNEIRTFVSTYWVYTFSATLSSLRNWASNDRYRLRPSTPAQLCWSSSRLQPLQNYYLIKFALIRPSTSNLDRHLWNFRGAPDETTFFFRCPSALTLFLHEIV